MFNKNYDLKSAEILRKLKIPPKVDKKKNAMMEYSMICYQMSYLKAYNSEIA